jgi:hypothetical protein
MSQKIVAVVRVVGRCSSSKSIPWARCAESLKSADSGDRRWCQRTDRARAQALTLAGTIARSEGH